jgi:hypothetical protein
MALPNGSRLDITTGVTCGVLRGVTTPGKVKPLPESRRVCVVVVLAGVMGGMPRRFGADDRV